jgi:C_GCAxxG_C_C family probable redox protein
MSAKSEKALEYFKTGFNCSQSVLTPFHEKFNLKENQSLKLACAFGAGMGRQQLTCGAVTGALMVLGSWFGKGKEDDNSKKTETYEKSVAFIQEFTRLHGSITCLDLLDRLHMNDPEEARIIEAKELYRVKCTRYVADAVEIVENLIE